MAFRAAASCAVRFCELPWAASIDPTPLAAVAEDTVPDSESVVVGLAASTSVVVESCAVESARRALACAASCDPAPDRLSLVVGSDADASVDVESDVDDASLLELLLSAPEDGPEEPAPEDPPTPPTSLIPAPDYFHQNPNSQFSS